MKCKNHPEKEADFICRSCSQPICEECRLNISGENVCKNCIEAGYYKKQSEGKLKVVFHFLCSLIPGAGQMQQGAMARGVQIMLSFVGLGVLAAILNLDELLFFSLVIWFYSFFDSYHVKRARALNIEGWDKEFIKSDYLNLIISQKESKWVGWILVTIGAISLLNAFFDLGSFFLDYKIIRFLQKSIIPGLALFLGWKILKKSNKFTEVPKEEIVAAPEIKETAENTDNIQG